MDIQSIKSNQNEFFQSGKTREVGFRLASLAKLESTIIRHEDAILEALSSDLGKPDAEAYLSEIYFLKKEIRLYQKMLKRWTRPVRTGSPFYYLPARSEIRKEPFGCTLVISPWNYPFQLCLAPAVSAVGAGNCVMLKPSEFAPQTSSIIAKLAGEVFDPGHVAVVEGDAEFSARLLEQDFDFIFFTGSVQVGKKVALAAARNLTPVILELGGKCPAIVDHDVDLDRAANRIAAEKFFNAGQTCFAPDYVVAHRDVRKELTDKITKEVESFYEKDPVGDLAKIVTDAHFDRLRDLVEEGESCFRMGTDIPEVRHLAPRILPAADWNSPSMKEEIFGPILPILGYENESDIIAKLVTLPSPLALYVFSRRMPFAEKVISSIPSGSVGINDLAKQVTNLELPFGGVGASGMGRYRGRFGFEAFSYQRPVTRRWFGKDFLEIQPPYEGKLEKNRRFLR